LADIDFFKTILSGKMKKAQIFNFQQFLNVHVTLFVNM